MLFPLRVSLPENIDQMEDVRGGVDFFPRGVDLEAQVGWDV